MWRFYTHNQPKKLLNEVDSLLNIMQKKYFKHPLTNQAYLIAVSYLIDADVIDYDGNSAERLIENVL